MNVANYTKNKHPAIQPRLHYHRTAADTHLYRIGLKLAAKHASNESLCIRPRSRPNRITYQVIVVIHIVFGERLKVSERKQGHDSPDRHFEKL